MSVSRLTGILRAKFRRLLRPIWTPRFSLRKVSKTPERFKRTICYLITEDGFDEHLSFICPCGCGDTVHLNLLRDDSPCWLLEEGRSERPSISPSVLRKVGCKSHFFIRLGRVSWLPKLRGMESEKAIEQA